MYIERNVFHLRFGVGKAAADLWQAFLAEARGTDPGIRARLLTDLTGPAYVLVLELEYDSYAELEPARCRLTRHPAWKAFYQEFIPFCERSDRTLYRVI
jgi:hypothetical protein